MNGQSIPTSINLQDLQNFFNADENSSIKAVRVIAFFEQLPEIDVDPFLYYVTVRAQVERKLRETEKFSIVKTNNVEVFGQIYSVKDLRDFFKLRGYSARSISSKVIRSIQAIPANESFSYSELYPVVHNKLKEELENRGIYNLVVDGVISPDELYIEPVTLVA